MANYQFDHIHLRSMDPLRRLNFTKHYLVPKGEHTTKAVGMSIRLNLNGQQFLISPPPPAESPRLAEFGLNHFGLKTDNLQKTVDELKTKE